MIDPVTPLDVSAVFRAAFTGHRPRNQAGRLPADLALHRPSIERVLRELAATAKSRGGELMLACSAASGADVEALEAAEALGIPAHVVLPLPIHEFRNDFGGLHAPYWPRAERLIKLARTGVHSWKLGVVEGLARPACYAACNERLLERAAVLVAVWDGKPSANPGGTANMVNMAASRDLSVLRVGM